MITDIDRLFGDFNKMKVGVIGDVMLDTYWWGHVERISPEAPVPVVAVKKKEQRIGGAGNVALNLKQLGASVALISIIGEDEEGAAVKQILKAQDIDTRYLIESKKRITTNKIRIISRNQHMMRLDAEQVNELDSNEEEILVNLIKKYITIESPDVIILEDYNKGVLTNRVITDTIAVCNSKGIPTTVDPKRKNFFGYKGATLFKPNLQEVFTSLNLLPEEVTDTLLQDIHEQLKKDLDHRISLITLSDKGIFYNDEKGNKLIPSHRREIADVSGAGDTVIAVASLVYANTKDTETAAAIANVAGGIVCEEVGTVPINKERLLAECKRLL